MQWRQANAALVLVGALVIGVQANAAPVTPGMSRMNVVTDGDPAMQEVYWARHDGVRIWVVGPPPYPYRWGPRPYYGTAPYWYAGRGYWHRRWHRGGWHYW
jgi:hypothetical protein